MKIFYLSSLLIITLLSCKAKPNYRYRIHGRVNVIVERPIDWTETNIIEENRRAIAWTDTIHGLNDDSIWYFNSDGTKTTLRAPYKIDTLWK